MDRADPMEFKQSGVLRTNLWVPQYEFVLFIEIGKWPFLQNCSVTSNVSFLYPGIGTHSPQKKVKAKEKYFFIQNCVEDVDI